MSKSRLEAFSDGVIAIIITIMVLELKAPHSTQLSDLAALTPVFLSYVLSFAYVGIYWNNHHHMIHTVTRVDGCILWANLHLLFWLSLVPFTTAWMGENHFAPLPVALYGFVMLMCGVAYFILSKHIIRTQGDRSLLKEAIGKDYKGKISLILYASATLLAFLSVWASMIIYIFVAAMWFAPDKRIEKKIKL